MKNNMYRWSGATYFLWLPQNLPRTARLACKTVEIIGIHANGGFPQFSLNGMWLICRLTKSAYYMAW